MKETLTLTQPDDWHLHLRDGALMAAVVREAARVFGRALIMPNLVEPVRCVADAEAYRNRILDALPEGSDFQPLMTLYLTAETTPADIRRASRSGIVFAIKLYPAGSTTNAAAGVRSWREVATVLAEMQTCGMPLSIHGEVADPDVDIFDRERVFLETTLMELMAAFPELRMVLEHLSTKEAVSVVQSAGDHLAATITVHHLLLSRNDLFAGGIRPHHFCLPIVKTAADRSALVKAALSGNPKFFLGTDSAPHFRKHKEQGFGRAGIYSAPAALSLCADLFEKAGSLERLEGFSAFFGADFYGLPRNTARLTLEKTEGTIIPEVIGVGDKALVPFKAGEPVRWQVSGFERM